MNLSEISNGEKAEVIKLEVDDKRLKRHLLDMGLTRGVVVTVKSTAPMGDPMQIMLRDYELCVSKSDLSKVKVKVIK